MNTREIIQNSEFLASLSHELRSPLNGIVGYTQLLNSTKLNKIQNEYVNSINQCCIQIIELVNDIMDFSKLSMGKMTLISEYFSIADLIEEIKSIMYTKIKEKKQRIDFVVDTNKLDFLYLDKKKILQVLVNLISNANKFTHNEGRIIITITKFDKYIEFSVEDNGIGISVENQKKLFTPFTQFNDTQEGFGLGLAICKKIIELFKGEIKIDSVLEKGTNFLVHIPYDFDICFEMEKKYNLESKYILIIDSDMDRRNILSEILFEFNAIPIFCHTEKEAINLLKRQSIDFSAIFIAENINKSILNEYHTFIITLTDDKNYDGIKVLYPITKLKIYNVLKKLMNNSKDCCQLNDIVENENKESLKILIAEDISYNLDVLVKMLNNLGYTDIVCVNNGQDAIKKLSETWFDVLFLDLKMPILNGFHVLDYISVNSIKIKSVVVSASILDSDREKCKELNVKYFLLKPINMSHLKTILHNLRFGSKK